MTEEICPQGHVIDKGSETCSRDGSRAIGYTENAPVLDEEVNEEVEVSTEDTEPVEDVEPESEEETTEEELEEETEDETTPETPEEEKTEEELG